ncbi:MAG: hypothetical protein K9G38_07545, partial [Bacteroidales bacterium]|nr:hypothetical protein [Bacteroidales bacterium]
MKNIWKFTWGRSLFLITLAGLAAGCNNSSDEAVAEQTGEIEFVSVPSGKFTMGADLDPKY